MIAEPQPGLITATDADTLKKCLDAIAFQFEGPISVCEIGVHNGNTARFIRHYVEQVLMAKLAYTGIDSQTDFAMHSPFPEAKFIVGFSQDVYEQVPDNSQAAIIVDGSHSYANTLMDCLLYGPKLKSKGLFIFHDTSVRIPDFKDYQHTGSRSNKLNWIRCRQALTDLGMYSSPETRGYALVYDIADPDADTGGYSVWRKL
jgi:hypothetical protein